MPEKKKSRNTAPKKKAPVGKAKERPRKEPEPEDEGPEEPDVNEEEEESGGEEEEEKEEEAEQEEEEDGIFKGLYLSIFGESWDMWVGSVILAIMSVCLFVIASPWGSSGGLVNLGQNLFDSLGMSLEESNPQGVVSLFDHRYAMLSIMMLIGALGSALMAREFAVRVAPAGEMAKGLLGGILMGIGCVLGMGCTVGNFFSGWAAMSGGAIIFVIGLVIGVIAAVKYSVWELMNHPGVTSGKSCTLLRAKSEGTSLQPLAGVIVLVIGALIALRYDSGSEKVLMGFVIFGLLIGIVLQRSRWCVVRSLREMFLSGDSDPAKAIIAGIVVGLMGFTVIKVMGVGAESSMVASNFWVPAIIGGIIFGFGMVIAGGCTVGSTWRAGEGHTKLWLALLGIVTAGPLTAEYLKPALLDALPEAMKQSVFLPDNYTYFGSVVIMLAILMIWYSFAAWNEKTGRFTAY